MPDQYEIEFRAIVEEIKSNTATHFPKVIKLDPEGRFFSWVSKNYPKDYREYKDMEESAEKIWLEKGSLDQFRYRTKQWARKYLWFCKMFQAAH